MKITVIMLLLMIWNAIPSTTMAADPAGQKTPGKKAALYDPARIYSGDFQPDVLLYKNPRSDAWQRVTKLDRLQYVTCQDALAHLNREGKWQGHLNPDGSCGSTAEPSDWVMGNRLNYENDLEEGK